jgi:hypothetical protein
MGRLQVIVKIATIALTPSNPTFNTGSWHIEGMENERIVASGIWYFSQTNVTASRLAFRAAVDPTGNRDYWEEGQDQDSFDEAGERMEEVYDLQEGEVLNQLLGSVHTRAGRCLAWPNLLQHQVQPFELADRSQPGHRRILVFFLVDPASRVLSTSHVPPQQREWRDDAIKEIRTQLYEQTPLPEVLMDLCIEFIFPMKDETHENEAQRIKRDNYAQVQGSIDVHRTQQPKGFTRENDRQCCFTSSLGCVLIPTLFSDTDLCLVCFCLCDFRQVALCELSSSVRPHSCNSFLLVTHSLSHFYGLRAFSSC